MATVGQLRLWDETPQITRNFVLETKLIDFGDMYSKKSISGLTFSVTENATSTSTFAITVYYRERIQDNWLAFAMFNNTGSSTSNNYNVSFSPIQNLENIQLKIQVHYVDGSFGINDIGLIYRTYRDSTTERFDET